jgi:tungstate transport system ATP-binding protein
MIEVSNVSKTYGGRTVIQIEKFCFKEGKSYALLGANGSGKTTLLKIMAGILQPDKPDTCRHSVRSPELGYLPQSPYAFIGTTIKNVAMAVLNRDEADEAAMLALKDLGMDHLAHAAGNRLSGGETQRMALARILAVKRKLLLLDEPTSASDLAGIDLAEGALHRYREKNNCTIIFSTHSPAQAARLSDEILFLDKGSIAESGPSGQLLSRPASHSLGQFLSHWKI